MQTVHVRVTDASTGRPTPCRVRLTGPDGAYFPPLGRLREVATAPGQDVGGNLLWQGRQFAYIDGSCEVCLPAAEIDAEVHKGPEFRPLRQRVVLTPGKISLRLTLERWADWRRDSWFSGDTRASLAPHAALLEAAAEDLAVVNVLAHFEERIPPAMRHILEFSGQVPALESPGHLVVVNTLNSGGEWGTLGLLNCHRVVHPLRLGGHEGLVGFTLQDWCDQCHRKGGLVVWTSFADHGPGGEALANLILGRIDAAEASRWPLFDDVRARWYDLLDCGLRVPLVGGSGKESNARLLGEPRTYARLQPGEEFSYRAWIEAVRAGRVFVTNGPLLSFTVDGQDAGSVVELPDAGQTVHVRAEAKGLQPFGRLELIRNGEVIARTQGTLDQPISIPEGGWLAVKCGDSDQAAHGSPVYVRVGGKRRAEPSAVARVLARLEEVRRRAESLTAWESDRQRTHILETLRGAADALRVDAGPEAG